MQTMSATTDAGSERLKILLVVNDLGFGGAEIQVADLATRFRRRGHDVMVTVLLKFFEFERQLNEIGVRTRALGMTQGSLRPRDVWQMTEVFRDFRPDVVHAHLAASILLTRAARAVVPVRAMIGTSHSPFERSELRYKMFRATDRLSDLWTNVCDEGVQTFAKHGAVHRDAALVTPNGIDVEKFAPSAERRARGRALVGARDEEFVWLSIGSFRSEQKDYTNLLTAFAEARKTAPHARLEIVGHGKLFDEKKALAAQLGIASAVTFHGLRGDVDQLMPGADGFVLGSAWEAFPIVLLESSASALPIVATRVGDNEVIVKDGETGFVVPPKDAAALAVAMSKLMALPVEARRALGARGRALCTEAFDLERVADQWEARYRRVLSRAPRRVARVL